MISLHPLLRNETDQVAHLVLPDGQVDFVGTITEMAHDPDPHVRLHYAQSGADIVGFFKTDYDLCRKIPQLPAGALGLRGLLVGGQYQGCSFGKMLLNMLPDYLRRTHSDACDIWLSVDAKNAHAIRCYESAGWLQTGPQRDGRCGKENVMRLSLIRG